ncbi:hypothetical protein ACTFIR_011035 [Dictyostelium discoideum]
MNDHYLEFDKNCSSNAFENYSSNVFEIFFLFFKDETDEEFYKNLFSRNYFKSIFQSKNMTNNNNDNNKNYNNFFESIIKTIFETNNFIAIKVLNEEYYYLTSKVKFGILGNYKILNWLLKTYGKTYILEYIKNNINDNEEPLQVFINSISSNIYLANPKSSESLESIIDLFKLLAEELNIEIPNCSKQRILSIILQICPLNNNYTIRFILKLFKFIRMLRDSKSFNKHLSIIESIEFSKEQLDMRLLDFIHNDQKQKQMFKALIKSYYENVFSNGFSFLYYYIYESIELFKSSQIINNNHSINPKYYTFTSFEYGDIELFKFTFNSLSIDDRNYLMNGREQLLLNGKIIFFKYSNDKSMNEKIKFINQVTMEINNSKGNHKFLEKTDKIEFLIYLFTYLIKINEIELLNVIFKDCNFNPYSKLKVSKSDYLYVCRYIKSISMLDFIYFNFKDMDNLIWDCKSWCNDNRFDLIEHYLNLNSKHVSGITMVNYDIKNETNLKLNNNKLTPISIEIKNTNDNIGSMKYFIEKYKNQNYKLSSLPKFKIYFHFDKNVNSTIFDNINNYKFIIENSLNYNCRQLSKNENQEAKEEEEEEVDYDLFDDNSVDNDNLVTNYCFKWSEFIPYQYVEFIKWIFETRQNDSKSGRLIISSHQLISFKYLIYLESNGIKYLNEIDSFISSTTSSSVENYLFFCAFNHCDLKTIDKIINILKKSNLNILSSLFNYTTMCGQIKVLKHLYKNHKFLFETFSSNNLSKQYNLE